MIFMHSRNEQLRQHILRIAEQERPALDDVIARLPAIANRPIFLVAPESYAGMVHGPRVVANLRHVVAAVDDQSTHLDSIHGAPRWSSQEFLANAGQYPNAVALRQHSPAHYYDLVLYASPVAGAEPPPWAN